MRVVETLGVVVGLGALFYLAVINFKHKIIPQKIKHCSHYTLFGAVCCHPRRGLRSSSCARSARSTSTRWILHVDYL